MSAFDLPRHDGLGATTRLRPLTSPTAQAEVRDWIVLVSAGMGAAVASTFLDFNLRIPGHAILRVVFPMAVGLALVPRRGAGTVMGGSALLTAFGLRLGGFAGEGLSLGALTSLIVSGPLLDATLRRTNGGWRQYAAFALAGLSASAAAFAVRGGAKLLGFEHVGARPLAAWLATACFTYAACGLAAGLISGVILFHARRNDAPQPEQEHA